jgi:tRNA-uridine 2-sulfurtransferase
MRQPSDVAVALSGGVDSAVAAVLLKRAGWRVYGLHLVLCGFDPGREARVREIAAKIGVPLAILDLRERFERRVIAPFCDAYLKGLTPNPCVRCNEEIKFEALYHYCLQEDIHTLATGHYVRLDDTDGGRDILRGIDRGKDQSYFLQRLGQGSLLKAVFPLGRMTKDAVRFLARDMNLPYHLRPESQEICFISRMDYREFVEGREGPAIRRKGRIVTAQGVLKGEHEGVYRYTIGQRHGLGIASSRPYYVKEIRPQVNEVVVARREALFTTTVRARQFHWIRGQQPPNGARLLGQVRYRHHAAPGRLDIVSGDEIRFIFDEPQWAVTPGQALALYDGERLMGGGWIVGEA